jgi:demethylmenaquinone methyltransferase/2-methoxy-6-polyprenyl-1,4-benzoquinol methylase
VDFSKVMCDRQKRRMKRRFEPDMEILCENALSTSIPDSSVDFIVSTFGLKTFNPEQIERLASEMHRILRPGGKCSLLEISTPPLKLTQIPYHFYISSIIPMIGRIFLKDIECYKMLGVYTKAFGGCAKIADYFQQAGFKVTLHTHFFGCATSLVLKKVA